MKSIFDTTVAAIALLVLSPLLAAIAVLVRISLGSPVFFRQKRPGLHARPFTVYKFRTMRGLPARALDAAASGAQGGEAPGAAAGSQRGAEVETASPLSAVDAVATDAERLTTLGRSLRRASLDELPQLFNVLRGDMSLVGPRPLLMEYLPLYSPEQARRHELRPGMTGWAQVNGRNAVFWEEKFALDVWYVDNRTLRLDIKILMLTVGQTLAAVFRPGGISQPGQATATPFTGSSRAVDAGLDATVAAGRGAADDASATVPARDSEVPPIAPPLASTPADERRR